MSFPVIESRGKIYLIFCVDRLLMDIAEMLVYNLNLRVLLSDYNEQLLIVIIKAIFLRKLP